MRQWIRLAEDHNPARFAPDILPWIYEAGNPYFEAFFGGAEEAECAIGRWSVRESSEVSLRRVTLLLDSGVPVGGFIGMDGAELARCRKADMIVAMSEGGVDIAGRDALMGRMGAVRGLFPSIEADQFYLSKMGVARARRGTGLGGATLQAFLEAGRAVGHRRFALDVWAGNERATALYLKEGFRIVHESTCGFPGVVYRTMALELEPR